MAEPTWKAWPEECPECGYELEVCSEDTREAWACDGDPVRCPNCGATGHISCSAEDDCYALMYDDQQGLTQNAGTLPHDAVILRRGNTEDNQ